MQKRNILSSPRLSELKRRRRIIILNKILFVLLGLTVCFILLSYLSRIKSLNISEIEVSGNKVVDTEMIRSVTQEQISGKYLWLFPKTNILYYPKSNIKNALEDKFKRIKDINFSIKDNKILVVSLTEREPKYTWCGASFSDTNNDSQKCFFMDEKGFIFDEAPYFSGEVYFKFYGTSEIGTYFHEQLFGQLISFKNALLDLRLRPVLLYFKDSGDIQIYLSPGKPGASRPYVIFNDSSDFEKIIGNLQTALETEPLKSDFKNKYSALEYIDLRYADKVYYRFR